MKRKQTIFSRLLDPFLFQFFGLHPDQEVKYVELRDQVKHKDHILYDMGIIDSKSSALLTHVSVMLAVVAVLISFAPDKFWKIIMTCELLAFSLVGMLLLRCVDVMGPPHRMPPEDTNEIAEFYYKEVLLRRGIYQSMVRTVFVLTLILIILIITETIVLS